VHRVTVDRWAPALWKATFNKARTATTTDNYRVSEMTITYSVGTSQDPSTTQLAATGSKRSAPKLSPNFGGKYE